MSSNITSPLGSGLMDSSATSSVTMSEKTCVPRGVVPLMTTVVVLRVGSDAMGIVGVAFAPPERHDQPVT